MYRFLFVAAQPQACAGGSELLWSRVAVELAAQGQAVIASLPQGSDFPAGDAHGVDVLTRATPHRRLSTRLLSRVGLSKPRSPLQSAFSEVLRTGQPDLVVINQPGYIEGVEWAEYCQRGKLPYVLVVHNVHRMEWLHPAYARRVAAAYRGARRVDLLSDDAEACLTDILGESLPNTARFQNPFLVDFHDRDSYPDTEAGFRIAFVGRIDPRQKGLDLLIRSMARPEWRERPVTVNLFGDGEHRAFLAEMAKRLGAEDKVHFEGSSNDIRSIWRRHHLLFMPSRFEGLPIALIEAMLCGRAALATAVGGIPEWIQDGQNGFLIPAATPDLVDAGLRRAWEHRQQWNAMGEAARVTLETRIHPDPTRHYACDLLNLLR